jgi:hypothetical protein
MLPVGLVVPVTGEMRLTEDVDVEGLDSDSRTLLPRRE